MKTISEKVEEMLANEKEKKKEMLKMSSTENETDTGTSPEIDIPIADDEDTQREISGVLWGIFILTFVSQVLTAMMFLLTNPIATWQATLVMIIMAAQGTIIGGALKMLTKKLDYIRTKLDKSTIDNTKKDLAQDNLKERITMIETENTRLNGNLNDSYAEILKLKKELYNKID